MIKKFIDTIILLISSGAVFHRCTFLGALCAAWVVFGTAEDGNMFRRLFTGDLYLFMGAFVVFYRLVFKKTLTGRGDPDLQATAMPFWPCFALRFFYRLLSQATNPQRHSKFKPSEEPTP